MKTNKNIDRLFQEKLKDFEVAPPADAWKAIETNLHGKKPKALLPLWLRITGAAAILLLLGITTANYFSKENNGTDIVDIDKTPTKIEQNLDNNQFKNDENNTIIADVNSQENNVEKTLSNDANNTLKTDVNSNTTDRNSESNTSIANVKKSGNKKSTDAIFNNSNNNSSIVKTNNFTEKSKIENTLKNKVESPKNNLTNSENSTQSSEKNTVIASNVTNNQNSTENVLNENVNDDFDNKKSQTENSIKSSSSNNSNKIASVILDKKNDGQNENSSLENEQKDNSKEIENTENVVAQITEENAEDKKLENVEKLEELLNSTDDKDKEKEEITKKWSVATSVAPIFYNSFSTKGSPLDLQFENSPKSGTRSVAYGVKVAYQLNDKLSLQSGISKLDVGYNIGDVYIKPAEQPLARLSNVIYNNTGTILNVNAGNFLDSSSIETNSVSPVRGDLNQSFGYIEVPLELKYRLTNTEKKLGVNVIGGFSTLFLDKNEVFVTTPEFSSNLGKANNLNSVNFSGNLGLDVDYKINKKIFINVAPMLKIHTKTFSKNDKNFEPYVLGVYTGLNYRF